MKKLLLFTSFICLIMTSGCSNEVKDTSQVNVSISIEQIKEDVSVLNEAKQAILPQGDYILEPTNVSFEEGDSAIEVLQEVCKEQKIQLELSDSYIQGIGNIYEFDAGDMSGWLFKVNGEMPTLGADAYLVEEDDELNWYYCVDYMKEFE